MAEKLICVIGVTGNQGGSVARRFLKDPRFRVRGLTRDNASDASQKLVGEGVEMVIANLDDVESLKAAFKGVNVIFSVTNYWEPFFRSDCRTKAEELSITCRKYAYDVEYRQGKNIADAAATVVDTLDVNGFLVSTLSHAAKCSNGTYKELYHYDAKADIFPGYVRENYPSLAAKASWIQTGYFNTSHRLLPGSYFVKVCQNPFKPLRTRCTTTETVLTSNLSSLWTAAYKCNYPPSLAKYSLIWLSLKTWEISPMLSIKCPRATITWRPARFAVGATGLRHGARFQEAQ